MPSPSRIAIYPGSFDPCTRGHEDIAQRALALFDTVIIAVAIAHHKTTRLPFAQRLALTKTLWACENRIQVHPLEGLLVNFCQIHQACAIVRGVRSGADWAYEAPLAQANRALSSHTVETCFLPANPVWSHVSSSLVWEVASLGGNVSSWVHPAVLAALSEHFDGPSHHG
jgi:pantetheine-phosphate adenylyltransferase